jgi:N-methylhydantoinase A
LATTRIGVDIGGTFTDLTFYDGATGRVRISKAATTPGALQEGVLAAVREALSEAEVADAQFFMHGTTVGLNALLERRGATTGLLCTQGFRDTLEIRRADRYTMFDITWRPPEPLVPRRFRLPVHGRVRADGEIVAPLERADVLEALETFSSGGVEAVAICFINAYANPEHELEAEAILREAGFDGEISLSHKLSREYREYERTSTTVIDAYLRAISARYLNQVQSGLEGVGFGGHILVTRSAGGAISARDFAERPVEAIQSGPVAGAEGVAELCRLEGLSLAIAADVGGTSFDTSLIVDGQTRVKHEGEVAGFPVQTPWVDVRSIGAGGGSIAYVDGGLLRVGPRSAGAKPGPACYDRGGTEPTVTDAALVLGMFGDGVLTRSFRLDRDLAEKAVQTVAEPLGLSMHEAAQGILTVAAAAMSEAIKEITVGQGEDPRDAALVCIGGAGPLFATLLGRELSVAQVAVPPHAGNFSAWGLLGQDVAHHAARTMISVFDEEQHSRVDEVIAELFAELENDRDSVAAEGEVERTVALDLRYVGQDHTLTITVADDDGTIGDHADEIRSSFEDDYLRRFGVILPEPLEVVTLRAIRRLRIDRPKLAAATLDHDAEPIERDSTASAYSFTENRWMDFALVDRASLAERPVDGPAIVFEPTATTYVDAGFGLRISSTGSMILTPQNGPGGPG